MLPESPEANQGNDIPAKFTMWQRPPSLFFGMRARTGGAVALTDGDPDLENPFRCDHLAPCVVRDLQGIATLRTCPLKPPQENGEPRFGFWGSPGHRLPPLAYSAGSG